jgi:serine carboxypeptidase-like clade 1
MRASQALWACACLLSTASAAVDADEVTKFPGFNGTMPSKVYSGYIKGAAASPSGKMQTFYSHYVLTQSQNVPTTDPLVLWQQVL